MCRARRAAARTPGRRSQKYELSYVRCRDCATLYISPRPTPAILGEYYATSENYAYWNKYIFPASEDARREKIFRPRGERLMAICQRHGVPRGTLLEVGAGFGTFCEEVTRLALFRAGHRGRAHARSGRDLPPQGARGHREAVEEVQPRRRPLSMRSRASR